MRLPHALRESRKGRQRVRRLVVLCKMQVVHELRRTFVERLDVDDMVRAAVLVVDAERTRRRIVARIEVRLLCHLTRRAVRADRRILYAARKIVQGLLVFHEILERVLDRIRISRGGTELVPHLKGQRRIVFVDDGIRTIRIVNTILLDAARAERRQLFDALESDVGKLGALRLVGRMRIGRIRLIGARDRCVRHKVGIRRKTLHRDRMAHDGCRTIRTDRDLLVVRT